MKNNIHYIIEDKNSKKILNQYVKSMDVLNEITYGDLKEILINEFKNNYFLEVDNYQIIINNKIINYDETISNNSLKFIIRINNNNNGK